MKYEKLDISNSKKGKWFLYGFLMCAILLIMFNFFMSYAKYKVVDSVKLAEGTVNYSRADFNLIGIKVQEMNEDGSGKELEGGLGKEYKDTNKIPEDGDYEFNEENTYCTISDNVHVTGKDALVEKGITITYDIDTGLIFSGIKQTNTKCYVYFDVLEKGSPGKTLADLDLKDLGQASNFNGAACESCGINNENGVYHAEDDYGTSYYFRGTVNNNWVKFGQKSDKDIYWRIIRINGNGTLRLIYAGETGSLGSNNTGKNAVSSQVYNSYDDDNKYLGFMYGGTKGVKSNSYEEAHKNETKSEILSALYNWWNTTNLGDLLAKIDGSTGFCNDRQSYNGNSSSSQPDIIGHGYGKIETYYGPYIRAKSTMQPTFLCAQKGQDLFTYKEDIGQGNGVLEKPIGLITADEVMYAGGYTKNSNEGFWLYTNQAYWTMSPYIVNNNGYASVLYLRPYGTLDYASVNATTPGMRPVINLKADTTFTTNKQEDKGTIDNPYIVQ